MTETVSDGGLRTTVVTPFTLTTLLSLPDTAICALTAGARVRVASEIKPAASGT